MVQGKRNSKLGGSFNSEILHVSGISNNSVSSHNRNDSNRSGIEQSDPFGKKNVRESQSSASSELSPNDDPFGFSNKAPVIKEVHTPEPQTVKGKGGGTPGFGRVRNRVAGKNKLESPKPQYSSKVRFSASDIDMSTNTRRTSKTVGFAQEISDPSDNVSETSEATIDPDLIDDADGDRKQSPMAKLGGGKGFGLHNATIDFATGAVRTR